jgi:hypothetical protein
MPSTRAQSVVAVGPCGEASRKVDQFDEQPAAKQTAAEPNPFDEFDEPKPAPQTGQPAPGGRTSQEAQSVRPLSEKYHLIQDGG